MFAHASFKICFYSTDISFIVNVLFYLAPAALLNIHGAVCDEDES